MSQSRHSSYPVGLDGLRRLQFLDGWRGIAIIALLLGHFSTFPMINPGRLGVELFFVLSGRLMAQILFEERLSLRHFVFRRFSRIYPALLAFVLTSWAATSVIPSLNVHGRDVLVALTFTLNYVGASGTFRHIWSLCVEEHAYLLLSIIAFVSRRRDIPVLRILGTLSFICVLNGALQTVVFDWSYSAVYWRTDVRAGSVLMGAAVYLWCREHDNTPSMLPLAAVLVGITLSMRIFPDYVKYSLGTLCLSYAVANLQRVTPLFVSFLSSKPFVFVGVMSFSLYLWQQPFHVWRKADVSIVILLTGVFVCGVGSFHLLERPVRLWLNKAFGKTKIGASDHRSSGHRASLQTA
jgi:peptidoglycan/LPS O-acetylase OafA/YrhL